MRSVPSFLSAVALAWSLPAAAEGVPGFVGDWQCGATRLVLTRLGSIEVVAGSEYRAGLYVARGAEVEVTWDRGGRSRLSLARAGEALRVLGLGAPLVCAPRR